MKNRYEVKGNEVTIFLQSKDGIFIETIIEREDFKKIDEFKGTWYAWWEKNTNSYYVVGNSVENGKRITVRMHRFIMDAPKNMVVDHKNRNTLDNKRGNLRILTREQNQQNLKPQKSNFLGIRGVAWEERSKSYKVTVKVDGKSKFIGRFKSLEEAAESAKNTRKKYMEFAVD